MNDDFLKIKAQWAAIIDLPKEQPKAPGMGNGAMLALGALCLVIMILAMFLERC